ncbi:hypothetical protein D1AOALGA4SA_6968 [Olavius algarvensis Delta 1 endosymbiont]|nr:hypothetical protein D1AOALGA4SA_6968 [Olavius algarvensis Delta 1 endosymbiont]
MKKILTLVLILYAAAFWGCGSHHTARPVGIESNHIVDIAIDSGSDSLKLNIRTNRSLDYTEHRMAKPSGVVFSFPDTKIGGLKGLYKSPENKIIRYIRADTHAVNGTPVATIYIALKGDAAYELNQEEDQLQVAFPISSAP